MISQIHIFPGPAGEHQRVQLVRLNSWQQLDTLIPAPAEEALTCFAKIYENYLIPACPWVFGNLVLFRLPQELEPMAGGGLTPLTAAAALLRKHLRFVGKRPVIRDEQTAQLYRSLEERGCLQVVRGKLPVTTVIPVAEKSGFLTRSAPAAELKVNGPFFIMDPFDCATIFDHVGTCFGLSVKDGVVHRPPLYSREALLVGKDGSVRVCVPELTQLCLQIGDVCLKPGENAVVYTRPRYARTPDGRGKKLVIVGNRVEAVYGQGRTPVPASGFVLGVDHACAVKPGDLVTYLGMEDVAFGIQVGNSIVKNGIPTRKFHSKFYNIRAFQPVPYPPCLYPLKFRASRAARIALGADAAGKPMLLWAEGAAKLGHQAGVDSCGATLEDMARICVELGMVNAVNMDGGGSAQILLNNRRSLCVSDRNAEDFSETERPIPMGFLVR